jgi:hypothetical protein
VNKFIILWKNCIGNPRSEFIIHYFAAFGSLLVAHVTQLDNAYIETPECFLQEKLEPFFCKNSLNFRLFRIFVDCVVLNYPAAPAKCKAGSVMGTVCVVETKK